MKHQIPHLLSTFVTSLFLISCLILSSPVKADYVLPKVMERLVLLMPLSEIGFDEENLLVTVDQKTYRFTLDISWMQDRIFSDGICTGNYAKAQSRIHEIRQAVINQSDSKVLIELVQPEDKSWFIVSYLNLFTPEIEFTRYFPEQTYYDTIKLPFDSQPNNKDEFTTQFKESTDKARQRFKTLNKFCSMEMETEKAYFAAGVLTIPQVTVDSKSDSFLNVQFKLAADGRWDLINAIPEKEPTLPDWLTTLIDELSAAPVANPPAQIFQYTYNDAIVYYLPARCCDIMSILYDANGNIICHPGGGIAGTGDGQCTDFYDTQQDEMIIWQDDRKCCPKLK